MKYNGIWFYGLSGAGKTYISKIIHKKINKSIVIDGDDVRKYISVDLDFTKNSRNIQIHRILGFSKIAINSNLFPIISTVWMTKKINAMCVKESILVIKIEREMKEIMKKHKTYTKNKKDIVGIDLKYEKLNTINYLNNSKNKVWFNLKKIILD